MATWRDLENYVRSHYKVNDGPKGMLALTFDIGSRSQTVFVQRGGNDQVGEWARVMSIIGPAGKLKLSAVCEEACDLVVGGIIKVGDLVMLAHSVPLADLDVDEFEIPLKVICITADVFEAKHRGGDYA